MRILYVNNGMGFGMDVSLGGSDRRVLEIAKRLSKKEVKIAFLVTSAGYKAFKKEGLRSQFFVIRPPFSIFVRMEHISLGRIMSYIISTIKSLIVLKLWVYKRGDIIYTASDFLCDTIPAWILLKRSKIKWIAMIHHYIDLPWRRQGYLAINILVYLSQQISFRLMRDADTILVYATPHGQRIKDFLLKHGFSRRNVVEVLNGIDYRFIVDIPEQKKIFTACFVGGLRPSKGIFDLVPIWRRICDERRDSRLLIIGGGTIGYMNKVRSAIKGEGLQENVFMADLSLVKNCSEPSSHVRSLSRRVMRKDGGYLFVRPWHAGFL